MVNVVNMNVNVDGVVMTNWSCNFSHNYKEYTIIGVYQKGKWAYSLAAVGSDEPTATLIVGCVRSQRTALTGLLMNVGMNHATASDYAGEVYSKIKSSLESLNPLF